MAAVERPDIVADTRFASRASRVDNYQDLSDALNEAFASRPRDEWMARLDANDVPHAPIYNFEELEADPQIAHMGTIYTIQHPTLGPLKAVQSPVFCDGAREEPASGPPELGEHSEIELRAVGFSDAEIARITAAKAA